MFKSLNNRLKQRFVQWLAEEPPPTEIIASDFNRLTHEVRPGDVLLFEGRSRIASFIRSVTQSPWTHSALYIGRYHDFDDPELKKLIAPYVTTKQGNPGLIFEGLIGKGAVVSPLSDYRHLHIRICRPIGLTPQDTHLVIAYTLKLLGRPYNIYQLVDLARFMLPWSILPRRWGSSLFKSSKGELAGVCSSWMAEAFESVQFPILPYITSLDKNMEVIPRNTHLFTPKDFDYSPYFEIIKTPVLGPEEAPYYRRLPWTQSGLVYHDGGVLKKSDTNKNTTDKSST